MKILLGLAYLLLVFGIVIGGISYYQGYERSYRGANERQLLAIVDLKVRELERYRDERLADAGLFHHNPAFRQLVQRLMASNAKEPDVLPELQAWLGTFIKHSSYDRIRLMDFRGETRFSIPGGLPPVDVGVVREVAGVMKSGRIGICDFYRNDVDGRVYLAVLVPIMDEADGSRPQGVLMLRIDPATYLYPFIQRWPVPSESAESLLIRRDGNEVVFLNEPRFQKEAALTLRAPLTNKKLPAAMAALGAEGIMEGVDYRGVPVVAAIRAVPDAPWCMVAKMDLTEVYGPLRERLWQVSGMIIVLVFGTGACVGMIWRQQSVRFYRRQLVLTKALHQAESTLQAAMDQSPVGIAIADAPAGTLRYVNNAGLLIRGGERAEIVDGIGIDQYVASWHLMDLDGRTLRDDEVPLTRAIMFGETSTREFIIRRDGGEDRLVLARAAPVRDEQEEVVAGVVVFMDVTERKEMEERLRLTLADLRRSNQELEQFAYVASHDLQEPLRMVASYAQLLAQRYDGQLDAKAQKYIHYAVDGAVRMQALINDLLAYSRVGAPGQKMEFSDSHAILGETLRNLSTLIHESRAIITNDELPKVWGNRTQLVMVFQNLLGNSIKFRRGDPPCVHVSAHDLGAEWEFSIKDNGIGIDLRFAERIFVIFQRLHTREEYPGTGIGLALCKRIVERHGGKIRFVSDPGHGTTFFFTLPKGRVE